MTGSSSAKAWVPGNCGSASLISSPNLPHVTNVGSHTKNGLLSMGRPMVNDILPSTGIVLTIQWFGYTRLSLTCYQWEAHQIGMLNYPIFGEAMGSSVFPHSHDHIHGQPSLLVTQSHRRMPRPWPLEKEEGTFEDGAGPQLFIIIIIIILILFEKPQL